MNEGNADAKLRDELKSIEQWASLMRRGQLTQPRAAGRSIGNSVKAILAALSRPQSADAATDQKLCSYCGAQYALLGAHYLDRIAALRASTAQAEAAIELERLRAEIEGLREALAETYHEMHACAPMMQGREGFGDVARALGKARAALSTASKAVPA